jgi:hypothetical protein
MKAVRLSLIVLMLMCFTNQVWAARKDHAKDSGKQAAQALANEEMKPADSKSETAPASKADASTPNVEAVKSEIQNRKMTSGTLDIYDSKTDKVRTLDLMDLKEEGDKVTGHFRDTKTGDVVSVQVKVTDGKVGDFEITGSEPAQALQEVKKDYSDQELKDFMKDYITTQSAGTGVFQLFDEKTQKMRQLEFVKLQDKVRRYGIIGITTAEFKEKDTGNTILTDVNVENGKEGLNVTAVRIKNVIKAGGTVPSDTSATTPKAGAAATPSEEPAK